MNFNKLIKCLQFFIVLMLIMFVFQIIFKKIYCMNLTKFKTKMFNILKSTKYFSSYNHLFKFNLSSNVFIIHEQHYKTLRVFFRILFF